MEALRQSAIAEVISGGIYPAGTRPRDSRQEDATVRFTTGTSGEIEEGVVTVNINVPDIIPRRDGINVENGVRTTLLERLLTDWASRLCDSPGPYLFQLREAVHTSEDAGCKEHYCVCRLSYRHYSYDD